MSKGDPQLPRIQPVGRAVASTAWVSNFGPWRSPPLQQIHAAAQARGDRGGACSYSWIRLAPARKTHSDPGSQGRIVEDELDV